MYKGLTSALKYSQIEKIEYFTYKWKIKKKKKVSKHKQKIDFMLKLNSKVGKEEC